MGKDVPCNIPAFTTIDAGAKWEELPTDSAQAHVLSLNSREGMEREGKEKQREGMARGCKEEKTAPRGRQGTLSSGWSQASGSMFLTVVFNCKQ